MDRYLFEMENSSSHQRCHPTPAMSQHHYTSFSTSSSYHFYQHRTPPRRPNPIPSTPFASDYDRSWQSEVSWQFEPTGWQENRNLGAAFSPFPAGGATPASNSSRVFRRSANDYYLSRTYGGGGGVQSFTNPYYDSSYSGYHPITSKRLELQSYVARDSERSVFERSYNLGVQAKSSKVPTMERTNKGNARNPSTSAGRDEVSMTDYDDISRQIRLMETYRDCQQYQDPRWFSVSRAYIEENVEGNHGGTPNHHETSHNHRVNDNLHHMHQRDYDHVGLSLHNSSDEMKYVDHIEQTHSKNIGAHDDTFGDLHPQLAFDEEDDEEEEARPPQPVGLLGLFKYSTKFDIFLVLLGCIGAFINGGSLPWYSYLFGNFVNKLARDQDGDKHKIMKEVEKICLLMTGLAALVVIGAYLDYLLENGGGEVGS